MYRWKSLVEWDTDAGKEDSEEVLAVRDIRVILYQELIKNAELTYKAYLEKSKEIGRVLQLIKNLGDEASSDPN